MPKPSILPTVKEWEGFVKEHKAQTAQLKKLDLTKFLEEALKGDKKGVFQGLQPAEELEKKCQAYYKAAKDVDDKFATAFRDEIWQPIVGYLDRVTTHREVVKNAPKTALKCAEVLSKLDPAKHSSKLLTDALLKITQLLSSVKVAVDTLRAAPMDTSDFNNIDTRIRDCKKRLMELEQVLQIAEKEKTNPDQVREWWFKRANPTTDMLATIGSELEEAMEE
jgi:hypothetical protein